MTEANRQGAPHVGFVAIVGAPNAGKSTLLNALVGSKLSIVSPKVQTTRSRVTGIGIEGATQIVFVDTPGIFRPKRRLERAMVSAAWQGANDADVVVLVTDSAKRRIDEDTKGIVDGLSKAGCEAVLVLNKVDLVSKERLLPRAQELNRMGRFAATFMVSAESGDGVGDLRRYLVAAMPEGPWLFPGDEISNLPTRFFAAEITREKLFLALHDELPYDLAVETETWQEFDDGAVKIEQVVYVRRESQRAIVLGKGGERIRAIREDAQKEMAQLMERPIHLFLFVKVRETWPDDPERYKHLGLDWTE